MRGWKFIEYSGYLKRFRFMNVWESGTKMWLNKKKGSGACRVGGPIAIFPSGKKFIRSNNTSHVQRAL